VLDAAGSARAAIYAESAAGPVAMLFAATQPERVRALVLADTAARFLVADDYPIGASPEQASAVVKWFSRVWGTDEMLRVTGGAMARDPEWSAALTRMFRAAATPRAAAAQYRYLFEHVDVRAALPAIQVPTLVIHTTGNPSLSIEHGRYLVEHIEGARLLEVPGASSGWSSYADMRKIGSSIGSGAVRPTPLVTGFLLPSTGLDGPSVAPGPSPTPPARSGSAYGLACTPVNARSEATTSAASPFTSPPGSAQRPGRTRSSSPEPFETWWLGRASSSPKAVNMS
jgi:hypothetical protein